MEWVQPFPVMPGPQTGEVNPPEGDGEAGLSLPNSGLPWDPGCSLASHPS